jgi:hypothetical protein
MVHTLSGSAESVRAIVDATERAVHALEADIASTEIGAPRGDGNNRAELEAELVRTLLTRTKDLKREAQELAAILERAGEHLGGRAASGAQEASGPAPPFNRRSTDPGSAERLNGKLPVSAYAGPERRHSAADAKMPDAATGNGKLNGGREPEKS